MARHKSEQRCVTVLSKKRGGGWRGGRRCAPFSFWEPRARRAWFRRSSTAQTKTPPRCAKTHVGVQVSIRWPTRSRFHDVHLQHRVCGVFLLHLIVGETHTHTLNYCTVAVRTGSAADALEIWAASLTFSLVFIFSPHHPSLYFKLLILSGSAQTSLSCTMTPRRERERES